MTDTQDLAALKRLTELDDDLDSDALDHLEDEAEKELMEDCLLYTSPSPRDV